MSEQREIWNHGREIILNAPQLYVDIDVEADGIAGYGSVLSIGAQSPTGESFYSEIKPQTKDYLEGHREFCETHGLERDRLFAEAPTLKLAMDGFRRWTEELRETHGKEPVLTAFNASFDFSHIDLAFVRAGILENPYGVAPFDLKSLAMPLTGNWDFSKTKKSNLPLEILPDGDFTHHALEDAQYQQKIHFGLAGILGAARYDALTRK